MLPTRSASRQALRVASRAFFSATPAAPFRPRRSFLYVPGSSQKMLAKPIESFGADTVCLDLEDGVAANQKMEARALIAQALQAQTPPPSVERMVRINPVSTDLGREDLEFILSQPVLPDGLSVPKLETPEELAYVHAALSAAEARVSEKLGRAIAPLPVIGLIESPAAVLALPSITRSDSAGRLAGVIFGGDDYGSAVGATRTASNHELAFARGFVVTAAKAARIQAIDIVYKTFRDTDGLRRECLEGAEMGFTGKQIIHPMQIATANAAFAPSPELMLWAKRVVEADAAHQAAGTGAFDLDGVMIDMPTVKLAAGLYERGLACGVTPAESK